MSTTTTTSLTAVATGNITGAVLWGDDSAGATKKFAASKIGTADTIASRGPSGQLVGAFFNTSDGSTSASTATFTTLFTLPGQGGYVIYQWVVSGGTAYLVAAVATCDGTNATLAKLSTGGSADMQLSGLNVQGKQSSGSTATISWSYVRIA